MNGRAREEQKAAESLRNETLQCNVVDFCFFGKHFRVSALKVVALIGETPHPASSLGHLLPKGEGKELRILALSRRERASRQAGTGEGHLINQRTWDCGSAALRYEHSRE
jgi:hypothetical protein